MCVDAHSLLSLLILLAQCPITCEIMQEPVIVFEDCHTYERAAITEWFARGNRTSPSTGKDLGSTNMGPNHQVKQSIEEFLQRRPELQRKEQIVQDHLIAVQIQQKESAAKAKANKVEVATGEPTGPPDTWSTEQVSPLLPPAPPPH